MAPTPSQRPISTPSRTPQSKHRLNFPNSKLANLKELSIPTEHPVEVITRIRNFPNSKPASISSLEVSSNNQSIRLRSDFGYRDFSLDGVSLSETEDLETFYRKFVGSRVEGVRLGAKCTIMMYGPTGSGKSHTMFGCSKEPGIVYRALRDILGGGDGDDYDGDFGIGVFVQVAVLEIYNEEVYDLLSGNLNPGGAGITQIPKGSTTPKVRLEVMGKKAKNATYISGNEAGKISREVAKVEKRRIVKSTNCNERSSRSHCLIILDVPSVGGRLMLVDMAGSENIEQAGQIGFEAKLQTAKINQGNTALKRVVESIANGDSHVPFRDSKLTMLLQDSFEDDKSKILMILCVSPDPKEMHKTISTLEYGAKAKCIVRAAHISTPKDKMISDESSTHLRSRIVAMNQFIWKLQMENKLREKERDNAQKELVKKEEELLAVTSRLKMVEGRTLVLKEEEINSKVDEKTQILELELMKMEEKMLRQQEELAALRKRLEEMELEKVKFNEDALNEIDGGKFVKRLSEIYGGDQGMEESMELERVKFNEEALNEIDDGGKFVTRLSEIYGGEQGMEKSMELDMGDQPIIHDVKEIKEEFSQHEHYWNGSQLNPQSSDAHDRVCLSTVFEREDEGEQSDNIEDYEVDKEVVEENFASRTKFFNGDSGLNGLQNCKDSAAARKTRIQNIFRLCGNYRELAQQVEGKTPLKTNDDGNTHSSPLSLGKLHENSIGNLNVESPISSLLGPLSRLHLGDQQKENCKPDGYERNIFS